MGFDGWPPQAIAWFEGLEQDNSRAYFTATRQVYEECVKAPLLALLDEVAAEFGTAHVFRPYRDVRFSADKSPYKRQASALVGGMYYVEVSMDGMLAAAGMYHLSRDQLERFRRAVDEDASGGDLAALVADARGRGYTVHGDALKTAPRGYPRDHPRVELLRHKGLALMADLPPGRALSSRRALDHVLATWRAAAPLNGWLAAHVGPAQEDDGRPR